MRALSTSISHYDVQSRYHEVDDITFVGIIFIQATSIGRISLCLAHLHFADESVFFQYSA